MIAEPHFAPTPPAIVVSVSAPWVERFGAAHQRTVEGIIETGRVLIEAKAALPHGEYGPYLDEIGVSSSGAHRRVKIFRRFANFPEPGKLPASIEALGVLADLDDDTLNTLIESGVVGVDTTRAAAERIVHHPTPAELPRLFDPDDYQMIDGPAVLVGDVSPSTTRAQALTLTSGDDPGEPVSAAAVFDGFASLGPERQRDVAEYIAGKIAMDRFETAFAGRYGFHPFDIDAVGPFVRTAPPDDVVEVWRIFRALNGENPWP